MSTSSEGCGPDRPAVRTRSLDNARDTGLEAEEEPMGSAYEADEQN